MSRSHVVVAVLALGTALVVWVVTSGGMDYPQRDSPAYVASAESLANDQGFRVPYGDPGKKIRFDTLGSPVVDFPPGYPLLLSIGVRLGIDPALTARLAASLMVAATTTLVFALARRRGLGVAGASTAAIVGAGITIPQSLAPQSEPLYGLLLVGSLWSASEFVRRKSPASLGIALALTVLAVTVRTVGLALAASLVVLVWIILKRPLQRWLGAGVVGLVGILPFLLAGATGNRAFVWHPMDLTDITIFIDAATGWLVPPVFTPTVRLVILGVGMLVLGAWLAASEANYAPSPDPGCTGLPSWATAAVSATAHIGLLIVTIFFLDAQTTLSTRLIYPVALSLLVGGIELYGQRSSSAAKLRSTRAVRVLAIAAVLAGVWTSVTEASALNEDERHFAADDFAQSETVEVALVQGGRYPMFSNVPDGLWVAGLDFVHTVPSVESRSNEEPIRDFAAEFARLEEVVSQDDGLIFFYRDHERPYLADEDTLREIAPCVISDDGDSILLAARDHPICVGEEPNSVSL